MEITPVVKIEKNMRRKQLRYRAVNLTFVVSSLYAFTSGTIAFELAVGSHMKRKASSGGQIEKKAI